MNPATKTFLKAIAAGLGVMLTAFVAWIASFDSPVPPTPEPPIPTPPAIILGKSGTASSNGTAAGNICPDLSKVNFFDRGNAWLAEFARPIIADPIDADSAKIIGDWKAYGDPKIHVDFSATGKGTTSNGRYGIPINVASSSKTPEVTPEWYYKDESDNVPYPILIDGSWEGLSPGADVSVKPDGDQHQLILSVDEATGEIVKLSETYKTWLDKSDPRGPTWKGGSGAVFDFRQGAKLPRQADWTSCDAAGLFILPLLLRYDEVASGEIKHCLRATFPAGVCKSKYVWPARHAASGWGLLCFGARVRLTSEWYDANKGKFSGQARVILEAMRNYGIINSDITGGGLAYGPFLGGITDDRWEPESLAALQTIPISAFEVVKQHPCYTIDGPTTGNPGEVLTFTVAKYPPTDRNYSGNVYPASNGKSETEINVAAVNLTDSATKQSRSGTFKFMSKVAGTFVISSNHGQQVWLEPSPITVVIK